MGKGSSSPAPAPKPAPEAVSKAPRNVSQIERSADVVPTRAVDPSSQQLLDPEEQKQKGLLG